MKLKERIDADFITAFKAKETNKKNFLGVIRGEVQNLAGRGVVIDDTAVLTILRKMEKSLIETGTESALAELEILKPYLPQLMSEDEVKELISKLIASGKDNLSLIMREFSTTYKGLADNKLVSKVVKEIVTN